MKRIVIALVLMLTVFSCDREKEAVVVIHTDFGQIHLILYDETPLHKANFIKLASEGYYDSTTFHRVIENFMIQGGDANSKDDDPKNDGQGGPGYTIPAEFVGKYFHKKGALAAARMGDQTNPKRASSGSQFYIVQGRVSPESELKKMEYNVNLQKKNQLLSNYVQNPKNYGVLQMLQGFQERNNRDSINWLIDSLRPIVEKDFKPFEYTEEQVQAYQSIGGTPHLDGSYTVFGEVILGLEVIDKIASQPKGRGDRPKKDIKMWVEVLEMKKSKIEEVYGYKFPKSQETSESK